MQVLKNRLEIQESTFNYPHSPLKPNHALDPRWSSLTPLHTHFAKCNYGVIITLMRVLSKIRGNGQIIPAPHDINLRIWLFG